MLLKDIIKELNETDENNQILIKLLEEVNEKSDYNLPSIWEENEFSNYKDTGEIFYPNFISYFMFHNILIIDRKDNENREIKTVKDFLSFYKNNNEEIDEVHLKIGSSNFTKKRLIFSWHILGIDVKENIVYFLIDKDDYKDHDFEENETVQIEQGNIKDYYDKGLICHCISNDWALGAGLAVQLENKFNIKKNKPNNTKVGEVHIVNNIANLITKEKYWQKPTYKTFEDSILSLKEKINKDTILVFPYKIGCGLDKLNWSKVLNLINLHLKEYNKYIIYLNEDDIYK